jgi:MarR family transcriptional regulator, organic hydroperoxide resistance regulator
MNDHPANAGPRYQALLQLLRTSETLWNASRVFFARWDLSPSQFNVLNLLSDTAQGFTQIELSRLLIMHRSNATGLIDRLEARGLLQRKAIPGDRRAHRVTLTAAGRRLVTLVLPEYYCIAERIWEGLPATRTRQLVRDLSMLSANAERIEKSL